MNTSTIEFYNKNAEQYVEQTQNILNSKRTITIFPSQS